MIRAQLHKHLKLSYANTVAKEATTPAPCLFFSPLYFTLFAKTHICLVTQLIC